MDPTFNAGSDQFAFFIQQLSTPIGMLAVMLFVVALFLVMFVPFMRWVYLGIAMWTSTLGFYGYARIGENILMTPLQQIRDYGRPITSALLITLLIPALMGQRGIRGKLTCAGLWGLGIYQIIFCSRLAAGGEYTRGVIGGMILFITFLVMLFGVTRWVQIPKDANKVINTIVFSIALFVISNVVQILVNRTAVVGDNARFYGTTGNPQHAGLVLSLSITPLLYFIFTPERKKVLRLAGVLMLIPLVGMTAWTGSRTAALVAVVSLGVMFRLKLGKLIYVLPILVIGFIATMQFADIQGFGEHLLDPTDTRSNVWMWNFQSFMENPLYGVATTGVGYSENSYLAIAANFGLVGLVPMIFMLVAACYAIIRIWRLRPSLGPYSTMAELVVAGIASLFIGAFFEGFLAGTLSYPIYILYLYLCLISFFFDLAQRQIYTQGVPYVLSQSDQRYAIQQAQFAY